ncbi:MAG: hypothetical protein ACOX6X_03535 [Dethiobacteria bacterium]|jgi:hypothetical protein
MEEVQTLQARPLTSYFLAIIIVILLLYFGLNAVERGIREISVPPEQGQVLHITREGEGITITFAGDHYHIPCGRYFQKLWPD